MLKAALEGSTPPDRRVTAVQTRAPIDLLHNPAFPCLRHAKGEVIEAPPAPEAGTFEAPDISSLILAGTSAPIGSIPADKVKVLNELYCFGGASSSPCVDAGTALSSFRSCRVCAPAERMRRDLLTLNFMQAVDFMHHMLTHHYTAALGR